MTSAPLPLELSQQDFREHFANEFWTEAIEILNRHGIDPLRSLARHSGFPDVIFTLEPLAAEWPHLCAARHLRFGPLGAVVCGYLVACATALQEAVDDERDYEVQHRLKLLAMSELRYQGLLTPPWLEVYGTIIGDFDQTMSDLSLMTIYDERRNALLRSRAGLQQDASLRIHAILNAQAYQPRRDDDRVIAALAALAVGFDMVPLDAPRRIGYVFEALDITGLAARPDHLAWSCVRAELFKLNPTG